MSMTHQLYLSVLSEEADAEELADLTGRLRRELLEIDIEDATHAQGTELPAGAKSLEAIDWNTLIITLVGSGGVITGLLAVFNSWVQRNPETKIHLELPNGGILNIEGNLQPGTELYKLAADLLQLTLQQEQNDLVFAADPTLAALRKKMNDHLNLQELKDIYFDLLLDYEQFGGESLNKDGKVQLLIKYCYRETKLVKLRSLCAMKNSHIEWSE